MIFFSYLATEICPGSVNNLLLTLEQETPIKSNVPHKKREWTN